MSELNIKKKILISITAVISAFIIVFGMIVYLSENITGLIYDEIPRGNAIFPYEADYTENIFADKEYMDLDRLINYTDLTTGITVSIDDENYASYPDAVKFMYEYITSIIYGDEIFYNQCYSQRYIDVEGEQYPFTMQKLYDIEFAISQTDAVTPDGVITKLWLDYKIFKNNITLRNDIGSDVCRRQHITLIREKDDAYKIISVSYVKSEPRLELNILHLIILIVIVVVILFVVVVGLILLFKSMKPKNSKKAPENQSSEAEDTEENQQEECTDAQND